MKKKYLEDYNYHDWSEFMVNKSDRLPKGPHFASVLLEKESRREHDPYTGNYVTHEVMVTTYFAFPDKETLTEWVLRASKAKKSFFCFEVKKIGEVEVNVNVDVGV